MALIFFRIDFDRKIFTYVQDYAFMKISLNLLLIWKLCFQIQIFANNYVFPTGFSSQKQKIF